LDVEAIERSTVAGVAPAKLVEIDGWLVPLDPGTIGRARSATPLSHTATPAALGIIEAAYRSEGLEPAFRIAEAPGLHAVRDALTARGYAAVQPTLVKIGDAQRLAAFRDEPAELMDQPDAAWGHVFLGAGFDPEDGANRVAALSRSPDAVYACVRHAGRTVAVGVATFGHGWAGIHGMRTAQDQRGRGCASQVLAALGRAIAARDLNQVFLQVEESNPARALYRKAGFAEAWRYRYWRR
jgi:ribosomal protein S18 acetylase RimI-like enzyme